MQRGRDDQGLTSYRLRTGGTRWCVRLTYRGRAYKWMGFTSKTEARSWYQDRKRDAREGRPFPDEEDQEECSQETTAEVMAHYFLQATNKRNQKGERTYAAFWTAWCGDIPLSEVTPTLVDRARTHLLTVGHTTKPLSHATVNRYVAWMHHVCRREVLAGRLVANPCARLKFREPKAPEQEWSTSQEAALASALGDQADFLRLAILTGLRQGEQFGLQIDDLDLDRGVGRLRDTKSGETQFFVINSAASTIFRKLIREAKRRGSPWVFPHPRDPDRHLNGKAWYKWTFRRAAQRAGIIISRKAGLTWHTLRHTFASRLQDAGGDIRDIKEAGRWKSWQAMSRYMKRKQERVKALVEKLATER